MLKDKEYQKILKQKKQKISKQIPLTKVEKRNYVMSTHEDYEILSEVKKLEKLNLNKEEKFIVKFVRSQLELDWRKELVKELNKMLARHKK